MTPRENLIQKGHITDLPLIKRTHNWSRKDIRLTQEQVDMLAKEYKLVFTTKNTEREALAQLRALKIKFSFYKTGLKIN